MIKINLLGEETVRDNSGYLILGGYVLSMVVLVLVCFLLNVSVNSSIENLTTESASLTAQLTELKKTTKEVRELEAKKKDLQEKRLVIANLKRSKIGPVRVMDDLNIAIPERAWLQEIREANGMMKISGFALDNPTIAAFMKDLEKSPYFKKNSIDLLETKQVMKDGVGIKQFTLQVGVSYAGADLVKEPAAAVAKNDNARPAA